MLTDVAINSTTTTAAIVTCIIFIFIYKILSTKANFEAGKSILCFSALIFLSFSISKFQFVFL